MKHINSLIHEVERIGRSIFHEIGGFEVDAWYEDTSCGIADIVMTAKSGDHIVDFAIQARKRITPQTALAICQQALTRAPDFIPVIYAPVISLRVADIAKQQGVGYIDAAGNCWLRSADHHLLIDRQGLRSELPRERFAVDPFSPKSSRVVRAMLSEPEKGWKLSELVHHPNVKVSMGLASKVKQVLIEEGYAREHQRLLYLRDPIGLLENWTKKYPGPAEKISLYVRGDVESAEAKVGSWCSAFQFASAASGFSAAWRLVPEVRYHVGSLYIDERAFAPDMLEWLCNTCEGRQVDSGANLELWRPFDRSVFANREVDHHAEGLATSALQTYLDLKQLSGRGEEAAAELFEKRIRERLQTAAKRMEGLEHGEI